MYLLGANLGKIIFLTDVMEERRETKDDTFLMTTCPDRLIKMIAMLHFVFFLLLK